MKRFKSNRLVRALGIALISSASLYGATITTANAGLFPGLEREYCMANAYLAEDDKNSLPLDTLNCTANDVEITAVTNPSISECTPGHIITFNADMTVRTNANERYDTTFYLPLTEQSPQDVSVELSPGDNPNNLSFPYYCSLLLPKASDAIDEQTYADLDMDECADITKKWGNDTYVLEQQSITMLCIDEDNDNQADFHYCAAWDNQERDNCTVDADPVPGQVPNTKSKCNCDTLNIPIFIKPTPPTIVKTLISEDSSLPEHGGTFDFTVSFTNPNDKTSLYISGLYDEIDIDGDGSYDATLDLWGAVTAVDVETATEGVYLTASTCKQPVSDNDPVGEPAGEIGPSNPYGCAFSVTIVDRTVSTNPDLYDDVIRLHLLDKNGDDVTNGETCPSDLSPGPDPIPGQFCSNKQQVSITNKLPAISVKKTATPDEVLEPGGIVTYTVEITSNAGTYDDPLVITSIMDNKFGDLTDTTANPDSTCITGQDLYLGVPYTCTFSHFIGGQPGFEHSNTVTAKAKDNEGFEASNFNLAMVTVKDVESKIDLVKTAAAPEVDETGDDLNLFRDLDYTFTFTNTSPVDTVTFKKLEDVRIDELNNPIGPVEDITALCIVDGVPLMNWISLAPGESASCTITMKLQGNYGDMHINKATIYGTDDDGVDLTASDPETVTFVDLPLQVTPEFAMKATFFVRLFNDNVDDVDVKGFTLAGVPVQPLNASGNFVILDEPPYSYDGLHGPYVFCGNLLSIGFGQTAECAFKLRLLPGFDTQDINMLANSLLVTVNDNDGGGDKIIAISTISIVSDE
ncbi:hypothetical protein [Shewanella sp. KCT]|uniref:hypothetical protein n=1 Tax=Shewanella sp. KCT TaxID=2569535 RepID=UPI0021B25445|nr:hypothetical protein [Shewanella sp. KCT]TVP16017.1 hypothetical protein AYI87_00900 [Shewanella sp. KCT]